MNGEAQPLAVSVASPAMTLGARCKMALMRGAQGVVPSLVVLILLVALAEWLKSRGFLPATVPSPGEVAASFFKDFDALQFHLRATVRAAALGFSLATAAALLMAGVSTMLPRTAAFIYNSAVVTYMMPLIALAPVLVIWFGTGIGARAIISALAAYFPIFIGAIQGLRVTDQRMHELFHLIAASPWQRFRRLGFPHSLPFLFSGLKIAAAGSVLGAIVSEWVGAEQGLGVMMAYALFAFNVAQVWLTILVAIVVAIAAFFIVHLVEKAILDWTPPIALGMEAALANARPASRYWPWSALRGVLTFVAFAASLVAAWYGLIWVLDLKPYTLPTPQQAVAAMVEQREVLLSSLALTLRTAGIGLAFSATAALAVAAVFVNFPLAARALMPYAIAIRSVPIIAIAPLITLIVGRGLAAGVIIVMIATFFPVFVNALRGLSSVSPAHLDLMEICAASRGKTFWMVRVPFSLPHVFAGFKAAAPVALLGAMLAEWLTGTPGLGYQLLDSMSMQDLPLLWAGMLLSMAAGLAIFWLTTFAEVRLLNRLG